MPKKVKKKGRPKKVDIQKDSNKESVELKKFLRWCFDGKFHGKNDGYLSETQIATNIKDKTREVADKLGYNWEIDYSDVGGL